MKKQCIYIIFIIIQFVIIKDIVAKETIIAGLSIDKSAEVILKNYFFSFKSRSDDSRRFNFKISIASPQYFQLNVGKIINVFLIPGDSIYINPDDKVSNNNESALISNYLIKWQTYTDSALANFDRIAFYSKPPVSFDSAVMNLYNFLTVPLNRLLMQHPDINREFVRLEKERFKFWIWCPFNRYEYRYQLYTGKKVQVPAKYYSYLNEVNYNDTSLLQLSDFNDFVNTYIEMKVFKASEQDRNSNLDPCFKTRVILNTVIESFTSQRIRDDILNKQMYNQIYYMDINDSLFSVVENTIKNPEYIDGLKKYYNSMQKFQAGNFAPDFKLKDIKDSTYTIGDFKGKYLLIDVWGIYCGPCIKEIPRLKEIKAEFKDANITFIQVNLDGTKDAWVKKVKSLNLDGFQFNVENGWKSEFQKSYRIDWVPTFILIDKDGKFIDARTKLPSENLNDVINNLPSIRN